MAGQIRRRPFVATLLLAVSLGAAGCDSAEPTPTSTEPDAVVDRAAGPLPAPAAARAPGVIAELPAAPTLVDGRLRVMGLDDRVWAEPLAASSGVAAFWSYRRKDADLVGYQVARNNAGRPLVVSYWDDGTLVGIDGSTGAPAWQGTGSREGFAGNPGKASFTGRSRHLILARGSRGDVAVVITTGRLTAVDAVTGAALWTWDKRSRCPDDDVFGMDTWESGGYLVVDAGCHKKKAALLVLDPRTGRTTATLDPPLPWPAENSKEAGVSALGCTGHRSGCSIFGIMPTGSTGGLRPLAWRIGAGGRADPVNAETIFVNGGRDGLYSVSEFELIQVTPDGRYGWRVTGETHDLSRPQFRSADPAGGLLWVSSYSWNGGPAALVGLDPRTGRLRTCSAPPRGQPIRFLRAEGEFLVVSDAREVVDVDADVLPPNAFQLLAPDTRPRGCPR